MKNLLILVCLTACTALTAPDNRQKTAPGALKTGAEQTEKYFPLLRGKRIALLANDDSAAGQALALWRQRDPGSLALRSATISLALREGRVRQARRDLLQLAASPDPAAWRHALSALATGRDPAVVAKVM